MEKIKNGLQLKSRESILRIKVRLICRLICAVGFCIFNSFVYNFYFLERSKNSPKSSSVTSAEHTKVPILPRKESKDVPHKKILSATPKTTLRKISTGFDASDISSSISNSSSPKIESSFNKNKLQNRPAFSKEKSVDEKLNLSSLQQKKQKLIKEQRQNNQQKVCF